MYGYSMEQLARVVALNQDHRLVRVKSNLDPEPFVVRQFQGVETVSSPYAYQIELLAVDAHLELKQVVGQPMSLSMQAGQAERIFHGYVTEFSRRGSDGGLAVYQADIAPWFDFLKHTSDCRIFQDLSVPDIIEQVFSKYGAVAVYRFDVSSGQYPPLNYCVQYNESDFSFVSRLLEDVGIHYYFEHEVDKHTLVMADDSKVSAFIDNRNVRFVEDQGASEAGGLDAWSSRRRVATNAHALKSFDFKQPRSALAVEHPFELPTGLMGSLEQYRYDGAAKYVNSTMGDALASIRSEETLWSAKLFTGEGDCRSLETGRCFVLDNHFDHLERGEDDRSFFLVSVSHRVKNNILQDGDGSEVGAVYRCEVSALRRKIPYRPLRVTPLQKMPGPQTATVVGPPGEELYADRYGRVKVQFHWDRRGKFRENSSCWVRSASSWAGADMGGVSPPRVGQEVVVDFLDGDPDRPLITGRVYNEDNMPPFGMEVSGLKSKTVKGAGFNEITMHDSAGGELLNMRAQRDMVTTVLNDQNASIQNNKSTSVAVNHSMNVGSNQDIGIGGNRGITISGTDTLGVTGTRSTSVTGAVTEHYQTGETKTIASAGYTETITGPFTTTLTGDYTSQRTGAWKETVTATSHRHVVGSVTELLDAGRTTSIVGQDKRSVNGAVRDDNTGVRTVDVTGAFEQNVSATHAQHANGEMTLSSAAKVLATVGGAAIEITDGAITISAGGSVVVIDGTGVSVNGAEIKLNC